MQPMQYSMPPSGGMPLYPVMTPAQPPIPHIPQPEVHKTEMSKQEMIKMLLTELAKN